VVIESEVPSPGSELHHYFWHLADAWYPSPRPYGQESAAIRVSTAVQAPILPLANGDVQERTTAGGLNGVRTSLPAPMESAVVVAGRYSTVTQEVHGKRVHTSTLRNHVGQEVPSENANAVAKAATGARQCLERWLGVPYPFADLQVVETDDAALDQAPGVMFVMREGFWVWHGQETVDANRVAREVARGWFPNVAKVWSPEEAWLGESLADYTSAYCLSLTNKCLFNARVNEWKRDSRWAGNEVSVLLAEHLGIDSDDLRARWSLLDGRGPLVVEGVRQRLIERNGEEKGTKMFFTWIRSYVKNFTYKPAHTRDLIAILEQITGESWQAYFEQYLFGTDPAPVE
jgi:hypothetical protein